MTVAQIVLIYAAIGSFVTAIACRVFPPSPGYQPPLSVILMALGVLIIFWPVLVLLALWYNLPRFFGRSSWSGSKFSADHSDAAFRDDDGSFGDPRNNGGGDPPRSSSSHSSGGGMRRSGFLSKPR